MNVIETPQNHAGAPSPVNEPGPAQAAAETSPTPEVVPDVEVRPLRRNRKPVAITIGAAGIIGAIALAYWRRRDLEWLFGEFLPYAQITGGLILWINSLEIDCCSVMYPAADASRRRPKPP